MALTITQQPQFVTPAYNDQDITAISTEYATTGFKYEVVVIINGEESRKLITPRPDGYMTYNAKEVVKNYIERSYLNLNSTTLEVATNKSVTVEVTINEYGISPIDTETITYKAWDASYKEEDFNSFDSDIIIPTGSTSLLSSNINEYKFPDSRVTLYTDLWIHFYNNEADRVTLRLFDENYNLITIVNLDLNTSPVPSIDDINYCNIGSKIFESQSPPVTPQVGWSVEFDIVDVDISTTLFYGFYTFTSICSKYPIYTLYYLKRNGNIGFFHFEKVSQKKSAKKTSYVRLGKKTIIGGVYTSNNWDREEHNVSTLTTYALTLNTDWITEAQSNALDELFDSPIVWLHDGTTYTPIKLTDTNYEYKYHANEKLFNYSINAEYSEQNNRQRGI